MTTSSLFDMAARVSRGAVVTLPEVELSVGPYQCAVPGWPGWVVMDLRRNAPLVLGWDAFDVCDLAEFWQRRPDDLEVVRAENETMVLPTAGELMDEAFRARVESMTYTLLAGWRVARLRSTLRGAGRPGARGSI